MRSSDRPVLLVHGIWDRGVRFDRMAAVLRASGLTPEALDLHPNDGRAPIPTLAAQVDEAVEALRAARDAERVDVVGFSMGALVARYWLQRLDGAARCRRFVSISGPHRGTAQAYWMPFFEGVRQMAPNSPLLTELAADEAPFGDVEVHALWTPYDLMIVPPSSSRLCGAAEHILPVPLHRFMISDRRAVARVRDILLA